MGRQHVYRVFALGNGRGGRGAEAAAATARELASERWFDFNDKNVTQISPEVSECPPDCMHERPATEPGRTARRHPPLTAKRPHLHTSNSTERQHKHT